MRCPCVISADGRETGIVECEIIQWFVEPEARVEEFSPLCEVQSDKASVEITSRFSASSRSCTTRRVRWPRSGSHLSTSIYRETRKRRTKEDLETLTPAEEPARDSPVQVKDLASVKSQGKQDSQPVSSENKTEMPGKRTHASLATPAVRHLSRELDVDIIRDRWPGKDGRVLKEDIYKFVESREELAKPKSRRRSQESWTTGVQKETRIQLANTQLQMFKTMTRSLAIPHFLYADETRLH